MLYNDNFERTQKYAEAFWNKELIDRPYVCVTAPRNGAEPVTEGVFCSPTNSFKAAVSGDYLPILQTYEKTVRSTFYGGEALPSFDATLGPDQYAAFLGAGIKTRDEFYTTWSEPCVTDWEAFPIAVEKGPGSSFDILKRFMEFAAEYGQDKFFVNMLDLHSNMDALSALRGPWTCAMTLWMSPKPSLKSLRRSMTPMTKSTGWHTLREIWNSAAPSGGAPYIAEAVRRSFSAISPVCSVPPRQGPS